ncbi:flotillin-1-like [Oscarella lobularis]|uniref:flotillin-1-like n=1 Tax=Oscarella lobularis TaxID=121494 RepID=UPI0033132EB0
MVWESCGPNEVLVLSGCGRGGNPTFIQGGRVWVWHCFQKLQRMSLNVMTLNVVSPKVFTNQGVAISVTGVAQVKVDASHDAMLKAACEQFLGKSTREIENIALETLEGHQRAIMGTMSVEEIYKDRQKFSTQVFDVAKSDLINMGVSVVSYVIKDISDEHGYLHALGMARTAEVKRDASIGEAEALKDSGIKAALADQARMASKYVNDIEVANSRRTFELKKAAYDIEVNTRKAESELAYHLQAAKTKQEIKEEQMEIKVVERRQQINVQEQEILRREKELEAQVKRPAQAERFRLETLAEANRQRVILEADAQAESIRLKGEAEAFAIEAKAKADAEQMAKKAEAWKDYQDAAMVDMVLETLPKVAAEVAAPFAQTNKIVMIAGENGEIGASKITGEVMDIVAKLPKSIEALTGVDISQALKIATHMKRK